MMTRRSSYWANIALLCSTLLAFTQPLLANHHHHHQKSKANLFVMTAPHAQLVPIANKPHQYELSLEGMKSHVTYFTDKPYHEMGTTSVAEFMKIWQMNHLNKDKNQPNVSLVTYAKPNTAPLVYVFEVRDPHYNVQTGKMQFTALAIGDNKPIADQSHQLKQASLFIDDIQWNGNKFKPPH